MPKTHNTVKIRASADKTWEVVGALDSVTRWVPGIATCRIEGSTRICNGGAIKEEISGYSPQERSYRFHHLRIPVPVQNSRGQFSVQPDGSHAIVSLDWEFDALEPGQKDDIAQMIDGAAKQTLEMLRALVEDEK